MVFFFLYKCVCKLRFFFALFIYLRDSILNAYAVVILYFANTTSTIQYVYYMWLVNVSKCKATTLSKKQKTNSMQRILKMFRVRYKYNNRVDSKPFSRPLHVNFTPVFQQYLSKLRIVGNNKLNRIFGALFHVHCALDSRMKQMYEFSNKLTVNYRSRSTAQLLVIRIWIFMFFLMSSVICNQTVSVLGVDCPSKNKVNNLLFLIKP